jgi:hypothetical protein
MARPQGLRISIVLIVLVMLLEYASPRGQCGWVVRRSGDGRGILLVATRNACSQRRLVGTMGGKEYE